MKIKKMGYLLVFICAAILSIYSFSLLAEKTYILFDIGEIETKMLYFEHILLFVIFYLILRFVKNNYIRLIGIGIFSLMYMILHQAATAFIVDCIYVLVLIWLGEIILAKAMKSHLEESNIVRYLNSFMIGSLAYIISVCILSALHIASKKEVRYFTIGLAIAVVAGYILLSFLKIILPMNKAGSNEISDKKNKNFFCIGSAISLSAILLQIGRINITMDYDSLRYGLRSLSVLIGDTGIYDNLGTVNDVYVYPKGLEILTLVLNTKKSFGFVLSFSYICAIMVLFTVFEIVRVCSDKSTDKSWLSVVLVSVVPAIMNMSISAKTDMITLLMQLISILNMCLYVKKRQSYYITFALIALLASTIYKPTSLLFSLGIGIANIIYLLVDWIKNRNKIKNIFSFAYLLIFPIAAIVLVYARTYILTGHIITSVYSSVWYKLGIETKYPYTIGDYRSAGMNMSSGESVDIFYRLFQLFISPTNETHIYIASPTVIISVLFVLMPVYTIKFWFKNNDKRDIFSYIFIVLIVDIGVSLLSLFILNQVDGNYFILLFLMVIIMVCFLVDKGQVKSLFYSLLPCIMFALLIMGVTNWAGIRGLTENPKSMRDLGIYNHHDRYIDKEILENTDSSFVDIYMDLTAMGNPRTLLLSEDDLLKALGLDIRTYTDITGSGGNSAVVRTLDNFKVYLNYAQIKYICVDDEYLEGRERAADVVRYLLEDGSTEVYRDYGDVVLYKVMIN
jgi:hypothetical protein